MKISGTRIPGALATGLLALAMLAQPGRLLAQTGGVVHGHVQNPAGQPVAQGQVKLTTDKNPSAPSAKFEYAFPLDQSGNYTSKGQDVKPGNYIGVVFVGNNTIDFMPIQLGAGEDKTVDFDMTRAEYVNKMSAADKAALEEYKKKNAETVAANAKIANLNSLLKQARTDTTTGNSAAAAGNYDSAGKAFDSAVKSMTDATTAKPDEPILWETLGDAQLGQANAAQKAAQANHATDASVPDKYAAAATSYQKAIDLNSKAAKPNPEITAAANNQLGQVYGKTGKNKEAAEAYDAAAKADPTKAGTYYFNEAATLFNASDMDDAAAAADKAIAADPNKVDAYYIKGQALIQKATVDPKTQKITAPPDCIAAYQKYLELAPTGSHAEEIKGILQGIGASVETKYSAPGAKKK